jgi:hypothetical protein
MATPDAKNPFSATPAQRPAGELLYLSLSRGRRELEGTTPAERYGVTS